jgi:hypothetical protein
MGFFLNLLVLFLVLCFLPPLFLVSISLGRDIFRMKQPTATAYPRTISVSLCSWECELLGTLEGMQSEHGCITNSSRRMLFILLPCSFYPVTLSYLTRWQLHG